MDELFDILTFGGPRLVWFARRQSGGIAGGSVSSPKALSRLVHHLSPQWDIYFAINRGALMPSGIRMASSDVTHWQTVLLDIDPVTDHAEPLEAAGAYLTRAARTLGCEVPALVVDSGRGVQVHIRLEPYALHSALDRLTIRRAVGAFLRVVSEATAPLFGCKLDLSCSDLARVARMPGTINHKTGRRSRILSDSEGVPFCAAGQHLPSNAVQNILALAGSLDTELTHKPIEGVVRYQQVWSLLTATAQKFLSDGVPSGERHRSCVAAVKSLQENGVPQSEAERAVNQGASRCDPPLERSEASRILQAAYR